MSRTYRRTTNRRRQDDRDLAVRAVRRNPPDAAKLSRAFINLALARAEADAQAATAKPPTQSAGGTDGST